MCSILLARVKKRSKRPVISASTCSGGIPEKNVATTTTGMLIAGKRSTGIRMTLLRPTMARTKQTTTTTCGFRIANRDILRLRRLSCLPAADHVPERGDGEHACDDG